MEDQLAYKLCQPLPMPLLLNTATNQIIQKVCGDITCEKRPLILSNDDMQNHTDHINQVSEIESFVSGFANEMSRLANQNIRLYQEFTQNKENLALIQILEQGEPHLKRLEEQVIRQKTDIAIDITNLQEKITVMIQQIKEENMKRLDTFLEQYKTSFITLKKNIDSFFLLSRKNFYYSNQNTFQMKLTSISTGDAQSLISNLKQHLNLSKQLAGTATPLQMLTDLQSLARFLLRMTNSPPSYDKLQNPQQNILDSVVREVGQVLGGVISTRLFVPLGNSKEISQVGTGDNNLQLQMDAKNIEKFQLKPSKRYQVDTQVSCILSLTDTVFALGSSTDNSLRIFDTTIKKIQTFTGHNGNIIFLEKIVQMDSQNRCFISLGTDKLAIVWNLEDLSASTQPRLFKKIVLAAPAIYALDMKDMNHFAFCDNNRDVSICNFFTQKIGTYNNSKHLQKINGLTLLKKGEKLLSYSNDSIINIWRVGRQNQDPILILDYTLADPLYGQISQIFITTQWVNQAVIISNEGSIKIFDLSKNCVVFSKFGNKKMNSNFQECFLIEESEKKINPPIWLIQISFNEAIAVQHYLTLSPYSMYSQDLKLEHTPSMPQQYAKHKVQIYNQINQSKLQTISVMFSEGNQELLVYELKGK